MKNEIFKYLDVSMRANVYFNIFKTKKESSEKKYLIDFKKGGISSF